jgi:hypothetical protein
VILDALVNPQAAMSGESTFHLADGFTPASLNTLIVKNEVALAQIEADRAKPVDPASPPPGNATERIKRFSNAGEDPRRPGDVVRPPVPPLPPKPPLPTRYVASVKLDPTRASLQMSTFMEEVMSHLQALPGAQIEMTLEVQVNAAGGIDEQTARIVLENSAQLKVDKPGLY